jgi:hypothetical protein
LHLLTAAVGDATDTAVRLARQAGLSWNEIAKPLAMTRQGAQQRWPDPTAQ